MIHKVLSLSAISLTHHGLLTVHLRLYLLFSLILLPTIILLKTIAMIADTSIWYFLHASMVLSTFSFPSYKNLIKLTPPNPFASEDPGAERAWWCALGPVLVCAADVLKWVCLQNQVPFEGDVSGASVL